MASGLSLGNGLSIPTNALTPQAGLSPGSGLTDGGLGGSSGPPPSVTNGFLLEASATDLILLESGDYLLQEA